MRQSLISMTGTFWDTVVICLMTGLTLVSSVLANPEVASAVSAGDSVLTFEVFAQIGDRQTADYDFAGSVRIFHYSGLVLLR